MSLRAGHSCNALPAPTLQAPVQAIPDQLRDLGYSEMQSWMTARDYDGQGEYLSAAPPPPLPPCPVTLRVSIGPMRV